jgi:hypothetical protein
MTGLFFHATVRTIRTEGWSMWIPKLVLKIKEEKKT